MRKLTLAKPFGENARLGEENRLYGGLDKISNPLCNEQIAYFFWSDNNEEHC